MCHISELSWDRKATPEAVVRPGDEVRCKVVRVDKAKSRIALSLKVPPLSFPPLFGPPAG